MSAVESCSESTETLSEAEADRPPLSLYHFPALYDHLRPPEPILSSNLNRYLDEYFGSREISILDPACGTASWLLDFARPNRRLFGNDNCPEMVAYAREKLAGRNALIEGGDMLRLDQHHGARDVVFELSGQYSVFTSDSLIVRGLERFTDYLRIGGLLLLVVHFTDGNTDGQKRLAYELAAPVNGSGVHASIRYFVTGFDQNTNTESIRRLVTTSPSAHFPPLIEDSYTLRLWSPEYFQNLTERLNRLELVGIYDLDDPTFTPLPMSLARGERALILKRVR